MDEIAVLECNIDDMSGELAGYTIERLLQQGALDVFYTPIYMKKNRPAVKLTVLCAIDHIQRMQHIIFSETSTIGIREYHTQRVCMSRQWESAKTPWGIVKMKICTIDNIKKYTPEYEDCKRIAEEQEIPLREVYQKAMQCFAESY